MSTNPITGREIPSFTSGAIDDDRPDWSVDEYETHRTGVCETLGDGECPWWPVCATS